MTTTPQSVPLDQPLYGASIGAAFARFWKKYATFSGRASLSEYWWWTLIAVLIEAVFAVLAHFGGAGVEDASGRMVGANALGVVVAVVLSLFALATIVPGLALVVRRLHDANLSGGFIFLVLIPGFGGLIILILTLLPSKPEGARFDRVG